MVAWDDLARGPERIDAASQSDPVLVREDRQYLYTLPTVVDDIDLCIGAVIRGHDHVTNTAAQIQIFEALGGAVPRFGHLPLLGGPDGEPLSKRLGSFSIDQLRADGIEPLALAIYLAGIGGGTGAGTLPTSLTDLARDFDLAHFGRGAPHFDPIALAAINKRLLHATSFDAVADRLRPLGCDERLWLAIRGNLDRLAMPPFGSRSAMARSRRRSRMPTSCGPLRRSCRQNPGRRKPGVPGQRRSRSNGPQGQGAVPSAAARTHGPRVRAGDGGTAAAHRARPRRRRLTSHG